MTAPTPTPTPTPTPLSYEVFVSDGIPRAGDQRMPNGEPIVSSPLASTLIHGEQDAVLVDPPLTREQTEKVGDWIERSGKRLAYVYATHGHGDHWFGTAQLLERFPGVTTYATEGTIRLMRRQATQGREQLWDKIFPGLIGDTTVLAQPIPEQGFLLEGNTVRAYEAGHTDTDDTTFLHVPSIGLVVAGDIAYNGVHPYILEGGDGGLDAWLKAIDRIAALQPRAVVAGHKDRNRPDDPAVLDETRQYLRDARRLLAQKPGPHDFFDRMMQLHGDRLNPGPLWYGALGLLG
ncbi:MBL fold metallo-hydrolase [Streptomyces sp. UNOC14_S4]|uniref:MBL fold metallo-hydrolase n=1 Tax=Streptomyces sp. UNOC14_S4 TaxID=2872340 RepID=UPI001E293356|nr:MBL fold metallo-hydrolase [Streptomyces sp. UNOC14_S4]MCC3769605.1 MBL fold metallo-hydrolase [Streptomyces sp. UNOC14_S4]